MLLIYDEVLVYEEVYTHHLIFLFRRRPLVHFDH